MIRFIFRAYRQLIVFAIGLLLGIQVPSFVVHYQIRVDAHYREVVDTFNSFRATAEFLADGDQEALVEYYRRSNNEVFEREGDRIQLAVDRYDRLMAERNVLQSGPIRAAVHVAFTSDREIFYETLGQYSYTVPLNMNTVLWGLAVAVILTLLVDMLFLACVSFLNVFRRRWFYQDYLR